MKTKTYVITGATSGIGKALTEKLALDNIVFAAYRSEDKAEDLKKISGNVYPFYVDYANPSTIKSAAEEILSKCTKIDTLINIAGCVVAGPIEKINMDEIRRQFNVNVFGHLELAQNLAEVLSGGRIINLSSMASFGIFPFISPYCASKRCLDMFFNSFLIENKHNIKVISIKPGVIATPLWSKSIEENTKNLTGCEEYQKELELIVAGARRNEIKGASVSKVVDTILKADRAKNPKLSYTVGSDAFAASLASKLPQCVVNKLISLGLAARMKRYYK